MYLLLNCEWKTKRILSRADLKPCDVKNKYIFLTREQGQITYGLIRITGICNETSANFTEDIVLRLILIQNFFNYNELSTLLQPIEDCFVKITLPLNGKDSLGYFRFMVFVKLHGLDIYVLIDRELFYFKTIT